MCSRNSLSKLLSFLLLAMLLQGCVFTLGPRIKTNQDELNARAQELETILVLTPEISIFELGLGDVQEERPEWSKKGIDNVITATREDLAGKGRIVKILDPETRHRREVNEIVNLKLAVMSSIYRHAALPVDMQTFPARLENFDYSVGDASTLVNAYSADGMLMIRGQDNISTKGRKAMGVLRALNPLDEGQQGGQTFLEFVLTDKKGDVLWWAWKYNAGGFDLRDPEEAKAFVKDTITSFRWGG